jgi:hypothetical protein
MLELEGFETIRRCTLPKLDTSSDLPDEDGDAPHTGRRIEPTASTRRERERERERERVSVDEEPGGLA